MSVQFNNPEIEELTEKSKRRVSSGINPYRIPYWLITMGVLWILVVTQMANDSDYLDAFDQIKNGIPLTIGLSFASYFVGIIIGLITGILRADPPKPLRTDRDAWTDWVFGFLSFVPVALIYVLVLSGIGALFVVLWGQANIIRIPGIAALVLVIVLYFAVPDNPLKFIFEYPLVRSILRNANNFLKLVIYETISFYVEFMRGMPPIVFLLIAGFIIVPAIREPITETIGIFWIPFHNQVLIPFLNFLFNHDLSIAANGETMPYMVKLYNDIVNGIFHEFTPLTEIVWRGRDPATAIAGLGLVYGAFLSEVFRAGIQSIPDGQVEAARSLGMTQYQTMRLIVIPQAIRNVLPPLGNNFISMIKDTSLVTILGTSDATQEARRWSGSQFTYIETYAVLSLVYLTMTVSGSLLVQLMERRLRKFAQR